MTQIDFYTHVANKLQVACKLAAKAHAQGLRVAVLCPDAASAQSLDRMLWTSPPLAFVPHCFASHPLAARTPVVIDHENAAPAHDEVLLNLRAQWPPVFSRFQRLLEIVSEDEDDRAAARERYKFYHERGYQIRTHNLA
ncbi:MAG: DNA polymerase III subunit chi [Betaproteobacteria bacterium]|nr:DNA polymerase III subunit chi [Betaproteobacteria bacterium]